MPKISPGTERFKNIKRKLDKLKEDYDFDDMKANDIFMLNQLAFLMTQMDEIELKLFEAANSGDIEGYKELQAIASSIRNDIIKYQDKLGITRKGRRSEKETTVVNFIQDLKKRASELYDREMIYCYCPVTKKLLGTFWIANKKGQHKVYLWCEDCKKHHFFNPAGLAKKKKRNSIEDVPDGL